MTLVDSNILIDIWTNDSEWAEWSGAALAAAADRGIVTVNPVIMGELAIRFDTEQQMNRELADAGIRRIPLPVGAGWLAGHAYSAYRARGGVRAATLPDFLIGAHAQVEEWPLLTRDPKRYRTYFPRVKLIAPK